MRMPFVVSRRVLNLAVLPHLLFIGGVTFAFEPPAEVTMVKKLGDSFMVNCRHDEHSGNLTWSGPKGPLGANTEPNVDVTSYGMPLYFKRITKSFNGVYTCRLGSRDIQKVKLTVQDPLSFVDTSPMQTGEEKRDVTLRCEVQGGDNPTITWSVIGGELEASKYEVIGDGLLIRNLSWRDPKDYICKATQENTGEVNSKEIRLKIFHKPYPIPDDRTTPVRVWGYVGAVVNMSCESVAEPPPKFVWHHQDNLIKKFGRILPVTDYKSVLELNIADPSTFGNYKCVVTNRYGTLVRLFSLEEGTLPKRPDFIALKAANSNLLDVEVHEHLNKTDPMAPLFYSIMYRPFGSNGDWKQQVFKVNTENSYPLINLKPNTQYEVKAASQNDVGYSEYLNISTFWTLNAATSVNPFEFLFYYYAVLFIFFYW